jgi:hypothetical protein
MDKIIVQPTSTAEWLALISEAQSACEVTLNEDLESYLVFLLMRFTEQSDIAHSVMALDFLRSHLLEGRHRTGLLRDVGDKCLLFAGLFPGRAQRRRVPISYFVHLGQSAYGELTHGPQTSTNDLFASLSQSFLYLMEVLQASRELADNTPSLTALEADELWRDTGSQHALRVLKRYTHGQPIWHLGDDIKLKH